MASSSLWQRFQQYFLRYDDLGFSIDISRMKFPEGYFDQMRPKIDKAFAAMRDLEAGGTANRDENRMVGHYWLRNPKLAPNATLRTEIETTNARIKQFAADVHSGKIKGGRGQKFQHVLSIGIGGLALSPYFIQHALGKSEKQLDIDVITDNDPNGFDREGFEIDNFLAGATAMDERTRANDFRQNAAMLLALMWFYIGNGRGEKDMVVLPYKDRLLLFSRYLQQLVMESLGKEKDLDGKTVNQGIAVYGNKGSTDQHAYVQQLRDGVLNFFLTFIEVAKDRNRAAFEVEDGVTSGDYLHGFLRGTRAALYENERESITVSIPEANAFNIGASIALYERAVGFYGTLVNINAYHQPGVEAGKKAATRLLQLQHDVREKLSGGTGKTAEEIARAIDADPEDVFHVLQHLASNDSRVQIAKGEEPSDDKFSLKE